MNNEVVSSRWSQEEASLSINARKLLAVERGLLHFQAQISVSTVAVYTDNFTAVSYLRKAGGTHSVTLNSICSEDSQVGRRSPHCSSPSVYHGEEQCASRRVVQSPVSWKLLLGDPILFLLLSIFEICNLNMRIFVP